MTDASSSKEMLATLDELHAPTRIPGLGELQFACGQAALTIRRLERSLSETRDSLQIANQLLGTANERIRALERIIYRRNWNELDADDRRLLAEVVERVAHETNSLPSEVK